MRNIDNVEHVKMGKHMRYLIFFCSLKLHAGGSGVGLNTALDTKLYLLAVCVYCLVHMNSTSDFLSGKIFSGVV